MSSATVAEEDRRLHAVLWDFELADRATLAEAYPQHRSLIERLTKTA